MARRKRSAVWMYYEEIPENAVTALCQLCSENIQHSNNTSNLLKHLKSKHPEEFASIVELKKLQVPSSGKKQVAGKKVKHLESESKKTSVRNTNIMKEVRVQCGDQEMTFLMPCLNISEPHGNQQSTETNSNSQQPSEMGGENSLPTGLVLEVQTSPDNNLGFNQSHVSGLTLNNGRGSNAITGMNVGEPVFVARKRTEWMDLFHESLRPHLQAMNRQQQRQYFSVVSQAVIEVLNSSGSSS